jgi:rfaE bifunctional protein nucleotidyltransferase chain/domain
MPVVSPSPTNRTGDAARLATALPRPLVFTNGVFDLFHAGHAASLLHARSLGAALVVGVNSDASARRLGKGHGRPFHAERDRCSVVAAIRGVDAVVCFDEDTPLALLRCLRPEVYVKGDDYAPDRLAEAGALREWGGRVEIFPRLPGLSTSAVIERIRVSFTPGPAPPRPGRTRCDR